MEGGEKGSPSQRATAQRVLQRAARRGIDWWGWRLAVDKRLSPRVRDLRCSFREAFEAHVVLDALDEVDDVMSPADP